MLWRRCLFLEKRFYSVSDEVLRVKYVIEAFGCGKSLLRNKILIIVDTHEESKGATKEKNVFYLKADLKCTVFCIVLRFNY